MRFCKETVHQLKTICSKKESDQCSTIKHLIATLKRNAQKTIA